jgi:hypothetical protein
MNENEAVVVNANGAFISPQMASFAATQWNEKNPKDGVAYIACSEKMLRKIETLYAKADPPRKDVTVTKHQQVISGIPIRVDKLVPKGEIHMRAADHRVVAKVVGLDE